MNSCPPAATETKCYCVTIEQRIYRHAYYANLQSTKTMVANILNNKIPC